MPSSLSRIGVMVGLLLSSLPLPVHAQEMLVAPYLQSVSQTEAWILWETSSGDESLVEWGATPDLDRTAGGTFQVGLDAARLHEVRLEGLEPDTR